MDFTLPESGDDVRGLAHDIATKISTPERVAELEAADAPIDETLWHALGAAGLLGLEVPSSLADNRGGDLTAIENTVVADELGRYLARVPFGMHSMVALPVIAARGSDTLRDRTLGAAAVGNLVITIAFTEDLSSDPLVPSTLLSSTAGRLEVSGTKVGVPYASAAAAMLVNAIGPDGPVAVVVRADDPGVRITPTPVTGKIPSAQVDLTDVPAEILAGGTAAVTDIADRAMLAVCAEQVGIVSRALELTAEYAREREQFGRAIGSFQAVAQRLADGYIDVQGLSLTTTQAAWLLSRPDDDTAAADTELHTAIATAKFWAAEAGHRIAHTTVHVHGGVGLDTSHPVHRYFLRAKENEFAFGSAPAMLQTIGAGLAATPA
ncbi:acyl-CoA dehydrogenase family protein [Gordonia rhizosphera]|uniref:Putative acyl-CoA dehydrogenase n=1 Tax=Gordonia rhizosphera NBRC 16068 TaxID=1108045 RepID=K6X394_9ACTN|nr:acyl-CoA dehydrogenase [Gordonia rhizosphera]GAB93269.1 putative acyl-CoA dehydrogenase [Gordonia rhizosphera NBRC 16068]